MPGAAHDDPACSVVIGTIGRPDLLDRCLAALSASDPLPYEAIVVDNTAGDAGTRLVAELHGARYVRERWSGLSGARNAGARASRAPFVAFLDDDAAPAEGWVGALLDAFSDPEVMAVTGRVVPFEAEAAARRRMRIPVEPDLGVESRAVSRTTPDWFEICNFGGLGIGANMAFRRAAFDLWPGFRESLGRGTPMQGGEEHHAFFELVRRGYKVVYTPEAAVEHRYPHTMAAIRRNEFRYLAGAAAYATLLLLEEPEYRQRTLKYVLESAAGRTRQWRPDGGNAQVTRRWTRYLAYLCGPALYPLSLACVGASRVAALCARLLGRD